MTYNAEILLGRISKVYGHDGTVNVRLEKKFIEKIPKMESVFLEVEGKPVPFLIESSDYPGGDILRLRFDGYDTVEKIAEFTNCRVLLASGVTFSLQENEDLDLIRGFVLKQSDGTTIGTITEIIENPGQLLAVVQTKNRDEVFIPLHQDLILEIDQNKKILIMELPEGLVDMNKPG